MILGSLSKTVIQRLGTGLIETVISNCVPKGRQNDDALT